MNILVIGRHADITETVVRLLNNENGWHAAGSLTDMDAIQKFEKESFDIVLIGGGVNEDSERELVTTFKRTKPAIKIVRHYGGGSGLLFAEIMEALKN
jgi:DNA-binding NarL/FixJ family response regulator